MSFRHLLYSIDGNVANTPNPIHHYDAFGNYLVTLVLGNDCGSDTITSLVNYTGQPTGIGGVINTASELKIYPNPARDKIVFHNLTGEKMKRIRVYNSVGQIMLEQYPESTKNQDFQLDSHGLNSGVYLIQILLNQGETIEKKIVIDR